MTPERQKWWDSLPAEEKRVRRSIAKQRATIQFAKAVMNDGFLFDTEEYMDDIREAKHAIKALRKQIGMLPFIEGYDTEDYLYCPVCHSIIGHLGYLDEKRPRCCDDCGQKLRWFE